MECVSLLRPSRVVEVANTTPNPKKKHDVGCDLINSSSRHWRSGDEHKKTQPESKRGNCANKKGRLFIIYAIHKTLTIVSGVPGESERMLWSLAARTMTGHRAKAQEDARWKKKDGKDFIATAEWKLIDGNFSLSFFSVRLQDDDENVTLSFLYLWYHCSWSHCWWCCCCCSSLQCRMAVISAAAVAVDVRVNCSETGFAADVGCCCVVGH